MILCTNTLRHERLARLVQFALQLVFQINCHQLISLKQDVLDVLVDKNDVMPEGAVGFYEVETSIRKTSKVMIH